ncbi:MAG: hypothetical protein IJE43_19490 [Alphaproteobacteria bacterium]|nr:hypothetical protein [Alphaproteobacteria bacterium]
MLGIFGNKAIELSKRDIVTLDKIDLLYMQAFSMKTAEYLRGFLLPACLEKISRQVCNYSNRYFADDKFRKTEWLLINVKGNYYTVKKQVTFAKIRINAVMSITAATDYAEQWVLVKRDKELLVMDIEKWRD